MGEEFGLVTAQVDPEIVRDVPEAQVVDEDEVEQYRGATKTCFVFVNIVGFAAVVTANVLAVVNAQKGMVGLVSNTGWGQDRPDGTNGTSTEPERAQEVDNVLNSIAAVVFCSFSLLELHADFFGSRQEKKHWGWFSLFSDLNWVSLVILLRSLKAEGACQGTDNENVGNLVMMISLVTLAVKLILDPFFSILIWFRGRRFDPEKKVYMKGSNEARLLGVTFKKWSREAPTYQVVMFWIILFPSVVGGLVAFPLLFMLYLGPWLLFSLIPTTVCFRNTTIAYAPVPFVTTVLLMITGFIGQLYTDNCKFYIDFQDAENAFVTEALLPIGMLILNPLIKLWFAKPRN